MILFAGVVSCGKKEKEKEAHIKEVHGTFFCDAEQTVTKEDKVYFKTGSNLFKAGNLQSSEEAFKGKYSMRVQKGYPYGMDMEFTNVQPNDYFKISVWRKSPNGRGQLIASGNSTDIFYGATHKPSRTLSNGWQLLILIAAIPPDFKAGESIKIFCVNTSDTAVYFDDLKIEYSSKEQALKFDGLDAINLSIPEEGMTQLQAYHELSHQKGMIPNEAKGYVKANFEYQGKSIPAQIRFKGDWLDHLQPNKWSFRIKLKDGSFLGMKTFSVQNPAARNFMDEWVIHQILKREDLLTPRYGFVPLKINGRSWGVYAYEEHFDKQLLESSNRREGPILKIDEEGFWERNKYKAAGNYFPNQPFYEAADILPFKMSRTMKSAALRAQFKIAQNLLHEHKFRLKPVSEIFDLERLASFYALMDMGRIWHGLRWHNIRFYYNPVIARLEPIGFDCSTGSIVDPFRKARIMGFQGKDVTKIPMIDQCQTYFVFSDPAFVSRYVYYLEKYSNPEYMETVMEELMPEIDRIEALINQEYPYAYDRQFLINNGISIKEKLPKYKERIENNTARFVYANGVNYSHCNYDFPFKSTSVKAFVEEEKEHYKITLYNYYCRELKVQSTKAALSGEVRLEQPLTLPPFQEDIQKTMLLVDEFPEFVTFMTNDSDAVYEQKVLPWPPPSATTPEQEIFAEALKNNGKYYTVKDNRILFNPGEHIITGNLVFPQGYEVVIPKGTTIVLNDEAKFMSRSPVKMQGTASDPIVVKSEDGTANAFTVLQANSRSELSYVTFDNLNTFDYNGWRMTGAVNFYESDVRINHCSFINNNCEDGLNIIRSHFELNHSLVQNTFADGFDADFCTGKVVRSRFENTGNDCIDFSGSEIEIMGCVIKNSGDKGISGGEHSTLTVKDTEIDGAKMAIASKDLSQLKVENISISNANYAFASYRKKPEYGPGKITVINSKETNVKERVFIEAGSEIILEGKKIIGNKKVNIDSLYTQ